MLVLWQEGNSTSREIAQRLQLSANAISPLLDRLEEHGLIARQRDRTDRRVVHITLTPEGATLESAVYDVQQVVECQTGLAPDDLGQLRGELAALAERMATKTANRDD